MSVPKRVAERIAATLKSFQGILQQQKARDISEADTVTIVKDLLSAVFGYDKYTELTGEHAIRATFCDLAVKLDGKLAFLIEVKAIGLELKDGHTRQAVDYAANQGCEWVVLTNSIDWRLYHVLFRKPIDAQEIARFDLLTVDPKDDADLERLYLITREGFTKSAMAEYRDRKEATSRFVLAAILLHSEPVQAAIRREIRRVSELLVPPEVIEKMLRNEVIKREAIEGEPAEQAARRVLRSAEKSIRKGSDRDDDDLKPAPEGQPEGPPLASSPTRPAES